jgi:hypothetical protein
MTDEIPKEDAPLLPTVETRRALIRAIVKRQFEKADQLMDEVRAHPAGNLIELEELYAKVKEFPWVYQHRYEFEHELLPEEFPQSYAKRPDSES